MVKNISEPAMKTIIYIITKSEVGGAQTWVRDQTKLFKDDFKQIIITNNPGWLSEQSYANKTYFVKEIESKFSISAFFNILKIIKAEKADIIVSSSANAGLYARLSKLFYKHHSIYVSHGWSCIYNGGKLKPIFIGIERMLSLVTDKILCVSDKDADNAKNIIGISERKIAIIRNAVFPLALKEHRSTETFRLLFVGRLVHPKRLDLLIEAIKNTSNVTLTVVGDGAHRQSYQYIDKVTFLGEIKSFSDFYQYDAFVLISDSEGLPMSAIEAASAGLPLILSDVGGCHELIEDNGLLVNNSVTEIAKAINNLQQKYISYEEAAFNKKNEFNLNSSKDLYFKLYNNSVD